MNASPSSSSTASTTPPPPYSLAAAAASSSHHSGINNMLGSHVRDTSNSIPKSNSNDDYFIGNISTPLPSSEQLSTMNNNNTHNHTFLPPLTNRGGIGGGNATLPTNINQPSPMSSCYWKNLGKYIYIYIYIDVWSMCNVLLYIFGFSILYTHINYYIYITYRIIVFNK